MTIETKQWSFVDKWFTYDNEDGSASNVVICPNCAPVFEKDPSSRPLENQTPDTTKSCVVCNKQWI